MVGLIWIVQDVHYPMLAEFSALLPVSAAIGHDSKVAQGLTATNWVGTLAWTARGVLLAAGAGHGVMGLR